MKKLLSAFFVLAVLLAACAPAGQPAAPQIVRETVIVQETVEIPVTITPLPTETEVAATETPAIVASATPKSAPMPLVRPAGDGCYSAEEVESKYEEYLNDYFQITGTLSTTVNVSSEITTVPNTCVYALSWDTDVVGENSHVYSANEVHAMSNVMSYYIFSADIVSVRMFMWFGTPPQRYVDERSLYEGTKTGGFYVFVTKK